MTKKLVPQTPPPQQQEAVADNNAMVQGDMGLAPIFQQNDPEKMLSVASRYAKVIYDIVERQHLVERIKGNKYVRVEGWTALAGLMGVFAHTEYAKRLDRGDDEIIYEAKVSMRTKNGQIICTGEAVCSNREEKKKYHDEFAIKSMAITRATGKACRLAFSWIMVLAGYNPTPAEEITPEMIEVDAEIIDPETPQRSQSAQKQSEHSKKEPITEKQREYIEKHILRSRYILAWEYFDLERALSVMTKDDASGLIERWGVERKKREDLMKTNKKAANEYIEKKWIEWRKRHSDLMDEFSKFEITRWPAIYTANHKDKQGGFDAPNRTNNPQQNLGSQEEENQTESSSHEQSE